MKPLYFSIIALFCLNAFGQETYLKSYKIRNFIDFLDDDKNKYDYDKLTDEEKLKVKFLSREKCVVYNDLTIEQKKSIDTKLNLVKDGILPKIELKDCNGNILIIDKSNFDNPLLKKMIGSTITVRAKTFGDSNYNDEVFKAGLLLEKDKLYVNLWPFKKVKPNQNYEQSDVSISKNFSKDSARVNYKEDKDLNVDKETRIALFYEIPDDHTAIFNFKEITVTAITIPLKYRFQTKRNALDASDPDNIKEIIVSSDEFSSSLNLALFGGFSWGKTRFTHREKIGNRINTSKNTIGLFLGSNAVELKTLNTNITLAQPKEEIEGTIGSISFGLGYVKSWNKVSIGIFSGVDKGVGRVSKNWVYNGKPWLGIGIGYDLFKL